MEHLGLCTTLIILIAFMLELDDQYVVARNIVSLGNNNLAKRKGKIKTIETEDGDIIDCVDIYKQPAFDHPLLQNHTIEMNPSFYSTRHRPRSTQTEILQSWQKNGQCPEMTIPIRRTHDIGDKKFFSNISQNTTQINMLPDTSTHEYALTFQDGDDLYGAFAKINVWNPKTEIGGETSIAQIWIVSELAGKLETMNTVEAGYHVYSNRYGDNLSRLFIYWTSDYYQTTGCYNLDCPGFVQVSTINYLGGPLSPVSTYKGNQYEVKMTITKDSKSGHWWLKVRDDVIGYWPGAIFSNLKVANEISWGGEVINKRSKGRHSSTQMGSGHFPSEVGINTSSYFSNIGVMDQFGKFRDAET